MYEALEQLGATVTAVKLYRWEMPEDMEPLRAAARRLAEGECDVVLFTSSIQLDHLLEVSAELGLRSAVEDSLRKRVAVGSIGPVMTVALEARGLPADIVPRHSKMWALVKAASEQAAGVLSAKRG
jgi:uroporphyrinogen-III synthase